MTPEKPIDVGEDPNQAAADGGDDGHKAPRLPRWTRHEILVLIEGKRVAESQVRRGRAGGGPGQAEPKWVLISSYCKRHGVNREPVQCRKRWGNLSGDFKKIKEWESQVKEEGESFWIMRNDLRRDKKLPGFFDREIYDVMDNAHGVVTTGRELVPVAVQDWKDKEGLGLVLGASVVDQGDDDDDEEAVFDSGRTAAADGIFSDFEQMKQEEDEEMEETPPATKTTIPAPLPISERRFEPLYQTVFYQGLITPAEIGLVAIFGRSAPSHVVADKTNSKQPASNPEKGSPSQEGQKRRRMSSDNGGDTTLQEQLVKVLESNNKMLAAQLEAQNVNSHLDRDQRKDQGDSLIGVLNKIADAIGKIADKI